MANKQPKKIFFKRYKAKKCCKTLLFATDVPKYSVNGEVMELDAPPENKMSRTYVPVRALSEAFGKKVY